jgi:hypothetical protein
MLYIVKIYCIFVECTANGLSAAGSNFQNSGNSSNGNAVYGGIATLGGTAN